MNENNYLDKRRERLEGVLRITTDALSSYNRGLPIGESVEFTESGVLFKLNDFEIEITELGEPTTPLKVVSSQS